MPVVDYTVNRHYLVIKERGLTFPHLDVELTR